MEVLGCPRRVLAQRPKPEVASLKSTRIYSIYIYIYIYIYSIHVYRENLDLTKVGAQIVSGVVQNARKWVSGGEIKFPVR